jgi:hypothetical protein
MTLSVLADFADIIAALAIILSLIFVGYELHQNRTQAELSNWRALCRTWSTTRGLTHDPTSPVHQRAQADYDALSATDRMRFGLYLEQGIHIIGNFLKHNNSLPRKLEGLEDAVTNMFIDMLTTPGGKAWWAEAHDTEGAASCRRPTRIVNAHLAKGRIRTAK